MSHNLSILDAEEYTSPRMSDGSISDGGRDLSERLGEQFDPSLFNFLLPEDLEDLSSMQPQHQGIDSLTQEALVEDVAMTDKPAKAVASNEGKSTQKKGRGRPKLEMREDTLAERRRAQIRKAQRAYRARRETTIVALKKENAELRDAVKRMSEIFSGLYQRTIAGGVVKSGAEIRREMASAAPEIGRLTSHISTTGPEAEKEEEDEGKSSGRSKAMKEKPDAPNVSRKSMQDTIQTSDVYPDPFVGAPGAISEISSMIPISDTELHDDDTIYLTSQAVVQYPHRTSPRNDLDFELYSAPFHSLDNIIKQHPGVLPLPKSAMYRKISFSRQLHYEALETGYKLITIQTMPVEVRNRAFRFCRARHSWEQITFRMRHLLEESTRAIVQAWTAPMSPESIPTPSSTSSSTCHSSNSLDNSLAAKDDWSQGLFERFFDAAEVEEYLSTRGVNILPGSPFAEVHVTAVAQSPWADALAFGHFDGTEEYLITFSVATLVGELLRNAICLRRGPGFDRSDVDVAMRETLLKTF